jgi:hypothetical protein
MKLIPKRRRPKLSPIGNITARLSQLPGICINLA